MKRKKVAVSACLLGEYCRYDGTTKADQRVIDRVKDYEVIPFCPEAPVLGTPRGRISVVETERGRRVLRDCDKEDVTELLLEQTRNLVDAHPELDAVILKSKSPSCGIGTAPVFDEAGHEICKGNGIAADFILCHYEASTVSDENTLQNVF